MMNDTGDSGAIWLKKEWSNEDPYVAGHPGYVSNFSRN